MNKFALRTCRSAGVSLTRRRVLANRSARRWGGEGRVQPAASEPRPTPISSRGSSTICASVFVEIETNLNLENPLGTISSQSGTASVWSLPVASPGASHLAGSAVCFGDGRPSDPRRAHRGARWLWCKSERPARLGRFRFSIER